MADTEEKSTDKSKQVGQRPQQVKPKLELEGPLNNCTVAVSYKPNSRFVFFVGNHPSLPHRKQVKDVDGNEFTVVTDRYGIGIKENLDLSMFEFVLDFNSISALSISDNKWSDSVVTPIIAEGATKSASQTKRLKIHPEVERIVKYDNLFPIEFFTFDETGKNGATEKFVLDFNYTVNIFTKDMAPLAKNVLDYAFSTNNEGFEKLIIQLVGYSLVEMHGRIAGNFARIKRVLEDK